ncbi:MAG: porin family protein [Prolixibacteraceae bacterium]
MMKKITIPVLLILMVQIASAQRFEGGILAGFNGSQVEGDTYKGYHKPGILAGFYVQTDVAPAIFTGLEIKFSQKGSRNKNKPDDPTPEKYIMRLDYVDVPLLFGFRTNEWGAVVAGISAGYLISGKEFDEYGQFVQEDQNEFNDFDLQPFAGFQFGMLDNVKLDLRLALSVLPVRERPLDTNYYWINNQFNNVISLALYYRIDR